MKLFVKRDLDGFFGLFIDNLVQFLVIISFCQIFCGMTGENADLLYKVILPGCAVSLLFGNVFYAWQAHRLA
ncbi:NCS2 family permease, partial [bacterium]|nr:NCS2 family permease [bacterium]